jgi:hypothetical protein
LVKEQTPVLCLAAVQQYGYALQYVNEQTPELCLAAVQKYGRALQFVIAQTQELCLAKMDMLYNMLMNKRLNFVYQP